MYQDVLSILHSRDFLFLSEIMEGFDAINSHPIWKSDDSIGVRVLFVDIGMVNFQPQDGIDFQGY